MNLPFVPVPADWNRHPIYRKLRRKDPSYPDRLMHLIFTTAASREPGKLVVSDGTPLGVEDLADDHDGDVDAWAAFMAFGEGLGILAKEAEMWVLTIWDLFSRDPVAAEKDRARKAQDRAKEKHEKELAEKEAEIERFRAELKQISEASPDDSSETVQECPGVSEDVRECPEPSETVQESPPIDIDLDKDLYLHEDLRSNTTACAETALATKPPDRTRGAPATWSASHFKKVWSADKAVDTIERDYGRLAEAIGLPTRMPAKLKMDLIRTLGTEPWKSHEGDPLVHVVAMKLAINLAYNAELSGVVKTEQAWPFALMKGAGYLEPARKVCALNRDAVELKQKLISPDEAERLYVPTTLEKQELAGTNSS